MGRRVVLAGVCLSCGCDDRVLEIGGEPSSVNPSPDVGASDDDSPDLESSESVFWSEGIVEDIDLDALFGWRLCYRGRYRDDGDDVDDILDECDGESLLLGCGRSGSPALELAAMADRDDVLYDCGDDEDCFHEANEVGWYYSDHWSWGFLPPDREVERNSCDTEERDGHLRMCWHTESGELTEGYRCGNADDQAHGYDRYVFSLD